MGRINKGNQTYLTKGEAMKAVQILLAVERGIVVGVVNPLHFPQCKSENGKIAHKFTKYAGAVSKLWGDTERSYLDKIWFQCSKRSTICRYVEKCE